METYLAIVTKRDERAYAATPVPDETRDRILDAGRLAGNSKNRQRWEFVLVSGAARERLAETVYAPQNLRTAALVVAVVGEASGFDSGRCAQNMMLAAWEEGVASCPNGVRDPAGAAAILGAEARAILSFGYPTRPRDPQSRPPEEWSARANRKPLGELVREVRE